jgi:hypothetical protein
VLLEDGCLLCFALGLNLAVKLEIGLNMEQSIGLEEL